ncbi:hypothetical protein, partial [Dyadobacter tibetensis]|uniref:hypothetical protein n=1 Tax=Dyadobacter tibetensis TaxID=1211851 RepID=UPI0004721377
TVSIAPGGTHADAAETLYIGPGTYQIDGTWEIYAKNIVIDPNAIIQGTGSIQIYNPSVAGGAASITNVDGNNQSSSIGVAVVLNNASGMQITELPFPADLTAAGFSNNTADNTLYLGTDLNLAVDGADVTLDATVKGDLRFDSDATISNYSANRMVITNNSTVSHMVKDAFSSGSFFFPVGIADGDYTPTSLTGGGPYHVSVTDYAASVASVLTPEEGMDRTWHIYGATATSMT